MEHLEAYNRKLLANILPEHVAQHFLCSDKNIDVSAAPAAPRAPGGSSPRLMRGCCVPGAVPRAVRVGVRHVRVHPELLGILCRAGGQQRGRGVPAPPQRDYRRLRRNPCGGPVQVHREDQEHRRHVHGRIR